MIRLTVRRFICDTANCPRRTFAEPFAQLTTPYARFTSRLGHVLERVGLALAGRAGARLADQLGYGELLAEKAPVIYQMVRSYIATLRAAPSTAPPAPPTVRQVTGWLPRHPSALSEEE